MPLSRPREDAQQQGERGVTAGLRLRRDLSLRSPFGGNFSEVLGEVLLPDGVAVPTGATVYVGDKAARIDPNGRFRLARVPPGEHLVSIDQRALGVGLVTSPARTVGVWSEERRPTRVSLRLLEPGRVEGRVLVESSTGQQGETAEPTVDPFGGLAVHFQHARWPELHQIAVTGPDGGLVLARLLPGRWRVWPDSGDVPPTLELVGPSREIVIDVAEGQTVRLEPFLLRRRQRPESLHETPTLTLDGMLWGGGE